MSKFKLLAPLAILALFSCCGVSSRLSSIGEEYNVQKSFGDDALIPLDDTVVEEKDDFNDYVKDLDESDVTDDDEEEETEADVMAYRVDYWPTPSYRPPYWPKFLGSPRRLRPNTERLGFGELWFPTTNYGSHFYPIGGSIYRSKRSIEQKPEEDEVARSEKKSAEEIRDGRSFRTNGKISSQSLSDQIRSKASSQKRQGKSFRKWIEKKADKLRKKLDKKMAKKGLLRTRRAATGDTDRQPRSLKRWFEKKKEKLRAKWAKKWAKKSGSSYYRRFPNFPHYNYRTKRDVEQGDEPESTKVEEDGGDEAAGKGLKKRRIFRQQPYYWNPSYSTNIPYSYPYNPYPYPGPYNPSPSYPSAYPSVFDILAGLAGDVADWDSEDWEDDEEWKEKNRKASAERSAVAARSAHRGLLTSLIHGISHAALDRPSYYYNRPSRYNYYRPGGYYRPYTGSSFGDWRSKQAQSW